MRLLALTTALALAAPALAEEAGDAASPHPDAASGIIRVREVELGETPSPPPPRVAEQPAAESAKADRSFARFGLLVDAGFPEGAAVSVVYRPVPQVRLFAGPAWSVVAWGAQAGVTVIPWHLGLSPVISLEGGRYFASDATFLARNSSGIPEEIEPLLHDVSYDYAALHVGLELGTRNAFALSLRAGLARVWLDVRGTTTITDTSSGTGAVVTFSDPSLRGTLPSVKLGLQLWF